MNKSKIEKRQAGTAAESSANADVTTSSQTIGKPNVSGWASFAQGYPDENETVWLYNRHNRFVALGCRVWVGSDGEDAGWLWALLNGTIYGENGKIVAECEAYDDYAFTHWCRLPVLPCH